jgi:hypothetical protein
MVNMGIVKTIKDQLYGMDKNLMFGLGAKQFIGAVNEKGQSALQFKVNGAKHKGYVEISYNEGMDLYDLKAYTIRKTKGSFEYSTKVKYECEGIFFDQLPEILEDKCY